MRVGLEMGMSVCLAENILNHIQKYQGTTMQVVLDGMNLDAAVGVGRAQITDTAQCLVAQNCTVSSGVLTTVQWIISLLEVHVSACSG